MKNINFFKIRLDENGVIALNNGEKEDKKSLISMFF
jgi:hypothetical protein